MFSRKDVSYDEFKKTIYYLQFKVVVPLLGVRLEKTDFFKKGKFNKDLLEGKLLELYENNFK